MGYINLSCFTYPAPNADGTTIYGNAGRNSLLGPSLNSLDFSAMKTTSIRGESDRMKLQFRAEFYNILNHSNFLAANRQPHGVHGNGRYGGNRWKHYFNSDNEPPDSIRPQAPVLSDMANNRNLEKGLWGHITGCVGIKLGVV